jgi:hypothetical protein
MHFSRTFLAASGSLISAVSVANAAYTIQDSYDTTNFFDGFSFFSGGDPTHGFVKYTTATVANTSSLAGYANNAVYMGVDHTTANPTGGRASVRVSSDKTYTHGLFIADIAHMPGSICGVWPAFWTFGPNWPSSGEIDIIEGVNNAKTNTVTLHTSSGCTMQNTGSASGSTLGQTNCNAGNGNDGCGFGTTNGQAYGDGFNNIGGGVHAMQWTSTGISTYFFPRGAIPADITAGNPDPATWGTPVTAFGGSGCSIDQHFKNHQIIFDTTFCGDWAGNVWAQNPTCSSLATSCSSYVGANPSAFVNAYWLVNSVKVYQNGGAKTKREDVVPVPFLA